MNAFDNNLDLATLAYNQGPVRVQKGTYRTWYLEEVKEKYAVIENWLIQEGIDLTALAESGGDASDAGDADEDSPE